MAKAPKDESANSPKADAEAGAKDDAPWRWKPGQSGNPSGRPKVHKEWQDLCREKSPLALNKLLVIMLGKNEVAAVQAAKFVIEQGWGKAAQPIVGEGGGPLDLRAEIDVMTTGERRTRLAALLAKAKEQVAKQGG